MSRTWNFNLFTTQDQILFCNDFFLEKYSFPLLLSISKPQLSFEEQKKNSLFILKSLVLGQTIVTIDSSQVLLDFFFVPI